MSIDINEMLQSYGMDTEYPDKWTDSRFTSALATLGSSTIDETNSGALVEELLSSITTSQSVANDEEDPLGFSNSIMALLNRNSPSSAETRAERALYMPSSSSFDPRRFLNDVHADASLNDLRRGLQYLKQKIERNESGLRQMVDTDYESYVSTKRKLDDVMDQLHQIGVRKEAAFGFDQLEAKIDDASNQLIMSARPMDGFNAEKQRLENALKSIETHHKVLELPQLLIKYSDMGDHAQFVREFKRGQRLLDKLNKSQSQEERKLGALITNRTQHIQEKYREHLHKQLLHTNADGPYAPLLSRLMDLGVNENPAIDWLNHNINRFQNEISQTFSDLEFTVRRNATDSVASARKLDLITYLRYIHGETKDISANNISEASDVLDGSEHVDTEEAIGQWEQLLSIFNTLQYVLIRSSVFYREFLSLARNSTISGDTSSSTRLMPSEIETLKKQCHTLVQKTSSQLVECISKPVLSTLSVPISSENTKQVEDSEYCTFIPINSNSLAVAKYLGAILECLTVANDEIVNIFSGNIGDSNPLSQAIVTIKHQFVKALCECWIHDSQIIGNIQDWANGHECEFPGYFLLYHSLIIEKLRFLLDARRGGASTPETVTHITRVLPTALSLSVKSVEETLVISSQVTEANALQQAIALKLQPHQLSQDSKLLVTLNNLETLRVTQLEEIYDQFETVIKQSRYTAVIRNEVAHEVNTIATHLFDVYIRKKKARLSKILHQEIQRLIPLWRKDELKVQRVSNYIYECLMVLVETHALFMESCPQLTRRAILELYCHLLTNISEMLRNEVDTLSRYGTLQNVADLEYMRWAMNQFPETSDLCRRIFDDIKHASLDAEVWHNAKGGARAFVMDVLDQSIKNSQFEFNCFKSMGSS